MIFLLILLLICPNVYATTITTGYIPKAVDGTHVNDSTIFQDTNGNVGIGTILPLAGMSVMNGNVGVGTWKPVNSLAINGNTSIGYSGAATNLAPSNGLLVNGSVGIGTAAPTGKVEIAGGNVSIGTAKGTSILEVNNSANNTVAVATFIGSGGNTTIDQYGNFTGQGTNPTAGVSGTGVTSFQIKKTDGSGKDWRFEQQRLATNGSLELNYSPFSNPLFIFQTSGNLGIGTLSPTATLEVNGNFAVKGTTSNWSKKAGANTACNTTCGTSMCAFGEDTGVIGTLLACTDATADVCICMGP